MPNQSFNPLIASENIYIS